MGLGVGSLPAGGNTLVACCASCVNWTAILCGRPCTAFVRLIRSSKAFRRAALSCLVLFWHKTIYVYGSTRIVKEHGTATVWAHVHVAGRNHAIAVLATVLIDGSPPCNPLPRGCCGLDWPAVDGVIKHKSHRFVATSVAHGHRITPRSSTAAPSPQRTGGDKHSTHPIGGHRHAPVP